MNDYAKEMRDRLHAAHAEIATLKAERDSRQTAFEVSVDRFARVLDALKSASPASIVHDLNGEAACLRMIFDMRHQIEQLKAQSAAPIAEMSEALGDETLNSLYQVATGIRDLQSELAEIKAQNAELLQHVECCIEAYDNAIILEGGGMEDSISDARAYVEAIAKARGDQS